MQVPRRRSEQAVKRDTGPIMVASATLTKWQNQVAKLEKDVPAMIKEVERTKEHGDFSENAAYQDAKATLRRTYSRIESLKDRIKRAILIQKPAATSTIGLGSIVVLETGGKRFTFEILGQFEADPAHGRISDRSPLGQALLGRTIGDEVALDIKSGQVKYRIIEVR